MEPTTKAVYPTEQWCKPSLGYLKINTDASFSHGDNVGHWGTIMRDSSGNIVSSQWSPIDRCTCPAEAEAIAALEGIRLAANLNAPPERFGAALRLRWLWLEWTDTSKLWVGMGYQ